MFSIYCYRNVHENVNLFFLIKSTPIKLSLRISPYENREIFNIWDQ